MLKSCPHCKKEFETNFKSEHWCSHDCREKLKAAKYLAKWAKGSVPVISSKNRFRLYGPVNENWT